MVKRSDFVLRLYDELKTGLHEARLMQILSSLFLTSPIVYRYFLSHGGMDFEWRRNSFHADAVCA